MWSTESAGPKRTTMQVAMEEARLKKFAGTGSFLKQFAAAFQTLAKAIGEALVSIGQLIQAVGNALAGSRQRPAYPGAISYEQRGRGLSRSSFALVSG